VAKLDLVTEFVAAEEGPVERLINGKRFQRYTIEILTSVSVCLFVY
jgi:hypothetical protein